MPVSADGLGIAFGCLTTQTFQPITLRPHRVSNVHPLTLFPIFPFVGVDFIKKVGLTRRARGVSL